MTRTSLFVTSMTLAAVLCGPFSAFAQTAPSLATAQTFAVLAGSTVTNTGASTVAIDLGVSPGSAVTGFPPGLVIGGSIHAADAAALSAQNSVTAAYNNLAGQPFTGDLTGIDLGTQVLTAGVYRFNSSAQLTGQVTLNAQGNPNAVFIFQIGSTLTTAAASSVLLINGGQPCNVFWQVGSSATLGTGTGFFGNILALTSITLTTGASVSGRALARNGAVTMDTNNVSVSLCAGQALPPLPPAPPAPSTPPPATPAGTPDLEITKRSAGSFTVGVNGTYRIAVPNTGTAATAGTITVTDTLPAGLVFVSASGIGWSCSAVGQLVTCTTSASVGVGRSSEDILLTVRPVPAVAGSVINTATVVAGGPESNTSNNTATDISPLNLPVPTLSEWAMIMLAALLSLLGFAAIRRRRAV